MKEFLTARDVEDLIERGIKQVVLTDDIVVTDFARDLANMLGVVFVRSESLAQEFTQSEISQKTRRDTNKVQDPRLDISLDPKPAGCLHQHIVEDGVAETESVRLEVMKVQGGSTDSSLVDQLVEAVRRLSR